ncbi:hypothetical protein [Sphingomonas quercus]|uniref:Uncharacterized protein n=1 Tax=Sphingomonas quercus TaxID=2842451 RepID=A0ABS6BMV0_9SPHN|nr:hypothetical protein [Sphingomonas quercus]MBU3079121.1 hypothetical protein [Sphingomonas quercus]
MSDPRLATLLDRIGHALDRIEARPAHDPRLAARHQALREAMAQAVADLDRLIEADRP